MTETLYHDSVVLCCVATERAIHSRQTRPGAHDKLGAPRLGAHERGIMLRQTLYSGKKKKEKKGPPGIGVSHFQYQYSISLGPKTTLSTGTQLSIPVLTCDFCKNGRFASFHSEFPSKTQNQPQINHKTHLIPTNNISNKIFHTQLKQRGS